jgi:hypothetical protein
MNSAPLVEYKELGGEHGLALAGGAAASGPMASQLASSTKSRHAAEESVDRR